MEDRIEFILCDYLSFARTYAKLPPNRRTIEVVFLSPPWGGPEYLSGSPAKPGSSQEQEEHPTFSLKDVSPVPGDELFRLTKKISKNIAYYLPRNQDLQEVSRLVGRKDIIEIEEEWMGDKLKALTCYFGGLAAGQERLFDI